ncbi:uncharacterized protein EV420DRAFT_289062 [Desarmillaria tabescens]|uniref:F-box domain-containing protein n=1 Tax=Armillaria tabescens TaxID=1929756 RepID=A0AA39KES8_ARMTA|nr:uncharacterized protein EV420DRAFT_289062 [Desarmillaria tabescens]KAK0459775.1 hypothetical protein EV420DRAFT_289062 [Desarmillaria tabescens]
MVPSLTAAISYGDIPSNSDPGDSMMTNVGIIPQELVDSIIDEIPVDDPDTLRSCTLVNRSFFPRSHKRLFSTIILRSCSYKHANASIDPYRRFMRFVSLYAHYASLVKDIQLHDVYLPVSGSWFTQDDNVIPQILSRLPHLESISISSFDCCLSFPIMSALRNLFASPKLRSISFSKVVFYSPSYPLLSLFSRASGSKAIQIHGGVSYGAHYETPPPTTNHPSCQVDSLSIKMYPAAAADFIDCLLSRRSAVDVSSLRKLHIWTTWMKHAAIFNQLLAATKSTLEEVVVHTSNSSSRQLDISHVPRIRCFVMCLMSNFSPPLTALASLFGGRPREPCLMEEVDLHLLVKPEMLLQFPSSDGAALDDILVNVRRPC